MKILRTILFIAIAIIATSCSKIMPEGAFIKQTHAINQELSKFRVSDGLDVKFDSSVPAGTIEIHTYENIHDYVVIGQKDGEISVSIKPFSTIGADIQVVVSPEQFNEFVASGGSDIVCNELINRSMLTIVASGGSEIDLTNVEAADCNVELSGDSDLEMNGTTDKLKIEASGGSEFSTIGFACNSANITATGESDIELTVNNSLIASLSGGSKLYYGGNPQQVSVVASGSSEYKKIQ